MMLISRSFLAAMPVLLLVVSVGCQSGPPVQSHRLIEHQALIDFSGLQPPVMADAVRMQASTPGSWQVHAIEKKALYNHQQWKSPSAKTAVGVIYARLPLPLSADTLLWLGRQQYSQRSDDGKEVANWTDPLGRRWFEAETNKYHARGYAIVTGLDAWIVYMGYKLDTAPEPADISLAARCIETFVPVNAGEKAAAVPPTPATQPSITISSTPATQPTMRESMFKLMKSAR